MTLASLLAAPDPDPSDHGRLLICAAALALVAVALAAWRRPPEAVPHAICPLGTVATTVTVALAACSPCASRCGGS